MPTASTALAFCSEESCIVRELVPLPSCLCEQSWPLKSLQLQDWMEVKAEEQGRSQGLGYPP